LTSVVPVGDQATLKIKFIWDGLSPDVNGQYNTHYFWLIDDVKIYEIPGNDIVAGAHVYGLVDDMFGNGYAYGRTPLEQVGAMTFGAEALNNGANTQNGVNLAVTITGDNTFTGTSADSIIASGQQKDLFSSTDFTPAAVGTHTIAWTIEQDEADDNIGNNDLPSYMQEITTDIYSLDAFNVNASSAVTSTTTASFGADGADGMYLANKYYIAQQTLVSGAEILLGNSTVAGGEIYVHIIDTASFYAGTMNPSTSSNSHIVSAADVTAGSVQIFFDAEATLNAGVYFLAVELYSNGNVNDISVLDDNTYSQPADASMIYIPAGSQPGSFTNGNAYAIRMLVGDQWGVSVNESTLDGVSVYPNPSNGIVNISNDMNSENEITVYNMVGSVVATTTTASSTTLDLSANGTGVYIVKVSNANGTLVERVVIK